MGGMYAMRRANGDWFAFDDRGSCRVPVFRSSRDAQVARTRNAGMLLFKPVALDERAVTGMAPAEGNGPVSFCLVDDPSLNVNRGHSVDHTQLARILREAGGQAPVNGEG